VLQPVDRAALGSTGLVEDGEQGVDGPGDGEPQELLLAADVVVDRRLGAAGGTRQVLHAGRVVAALQELAGHDLEQLLEAVPVPAVAGRAGRGLRRQGHAPQATTAGVPPP
jgi:hypothetical protein